MAGRILLALLVTSLMAAWVFGKISTISSRIMQKNAFKYVLADTTVCRTVSGLTKAQIEVCYRQPDTTAVALEGLKHAVHECQHQFQGNRWNCSSLQTKANIPYTSAMLQRGYKETAFGYAISSASVVVAVARACSQGKLMNCGCLPQRYRSMSGSQREENVWKWGGCSDNVKFGMKFSKMFVDAREKGDDLQSRVNRHNNDVGRKIVSNSMQVKCKCHGMSGSCEMKTCWRTTPDYRQVGKLLKERYRSAVLVDQNNVGNRTPKNFKGSKPKKRRQKPHTRLKDFLPHKHPNRTKKEFSLNLFYYERSPNFCERDSVLDVAGTIGRKCNRTSTSSDNCGALCCGRGYNLQRHRKMERCNCKFHWCCTVECQTCFVEEWITVCK